jgi:uncharacterized protein (TIGR00251 family)
VVVTARAGKDEVAGWRGDELHVKVRSMPAEGKANAAVCAVVAEAVGVPKTSVAVVTGRKSRHKVIVIEDVTAAELGDRLGDVSRE